MPQPIAAVPARPPFVAQQPRASSGYAGCAMLPDFLMPPPPRPLTLLSAEPPQPAELPTGTEADFGLTAEITAQIAEAPEPLSPAQQAACCLRALVDELSGKRAHFVWRRLRGKQHEFN
ncbi:MAG: hypothetical protein EOO78_17105, partial [Oxalobacteraceae bacterium]